MHIQFMIEDSSSAALTEVLMEKLKDSVSLLTYDVKYFHGIGGFTRKNTVKEIKTGKLLNDLATYLRGFSKSLQGIQAAIFVIVDNDDRDTAEFRLALEEVAVKNHIAVDRVFCIAVEEVEAWLLGDKSAIYKAYPLAKKQVLDSYEQDSICGTWEVLAEAIHKGGLRNLKKSCASYREIGSRKKEWAEKIGVYMDCAANDSPSFRYFWQELQKRLLAC